MTHCYHFVKQYITQIISVFFQAEKKLSQNNKCHVLLWTVKFGLDLLPTWPSSHMCLAQKWPKNTKNPFFACFRAYVGQPHNHIGWTRSMPFASINPTNPRTNPGNFHEKILRIGGVENLSFFESAILIFFFKKNLLHSNENQSSFIG